jgi:hypothetical protein
VGFAAQLLAGEVPPALEDAFRDAGVNLFPSTWGDMRANCNCPDWENPCKHIAAVLYVYADLLDADPWQLLLWRGRTREDILGPLRGAATTGPTHHGLPPWWPLTPDRSSLPIGRVEPPAGEPPTPAHRVVQRMQALEADVGGIPFAELLPPVYEVLTTPPDLSTE